MNSAAGDERRVAFEDVNDIRVSGVNFRHAGLFAAAGMHHVWIAVIEQHGSFGERCCHFFL